MFANLDSVCLTLPALPGMYFEMSLEQIGSVKRPVAARELAEELLTALPLALLAAAGLGELRPHAARAGQVRVPVRHGSGRQQPLVEAVVILTRVRGHDVIQREVVLVRTFGENVCRQVRLRELGTGCKRWRIDNSGCLITDGGWGG